MTTIDLYHRLELATASDMGQAAAEAGVKAGDNPFACGTPAWLQWREAHRTQLVRERLRQGNLAECQDELDAADPQPESQFWRELKHAVRWITGRVA